MQHNATQWTAPKDGATLADLAIALDRSENILGFTRRAANGHLADVATQAGSFVVQTNLALVGEVLTDFDGQRIACCHCQKDIRMLWHRSEPQNDTTAVYTKKSISVGRWWVRFDPSWKLWKLTTNGKWQTAFEGAMYGSPSDAMYHADHYGI